MIARRLASCLSLCLLPLGGPVVAASPDDTLAVEYVTITEGPVTLDLSLTGTVEAKDSIMASFRAGGRITELPVTEGQRVPAGEPLARTDDVQQQQALQVAQAALDAADAARAQAAQAATRAAEMLRRGVGTRAAQDKAAEALSTAEGAVTQARAQLDQAQRALDDTVLRAPVDVVVTARLAERGQVVGPAQPVLSLAGLAGLEAVFETPDSALLDQAKGTSVRLEPLDTTGPDMTGTVTEISPLVGPQTGSVSLRVLIHDAPTDAALLGASVRGTISVPEGRGMTIPWTALTATGRDAAVWVVGADDTVSLAPVEIAGFKTDCVVLRSGPAPGTVVVAEGSQMLYPGRKVHRAEPRR